MAKAKKSSVGRPKGKAQKVSDAQRIRAVLEKFGITQSADEVRKQLVRKGGAVATRFRNDKAFAVKVSQVKRKLVGDKTGVVRASKGRMTAAERDLVEARLKIETLQKKLDKLTAKKAPKAKAVEAPAAEAVPENLIAEVVVPEAEPVAAAVETAPAAA